LGQACKRLHPTQYYDAVGAAHAAEVVSLDILAQLELVNLYLLFQIFLFGGGRLFVISWPLQEQLTIMDPGEGVRQKIEHMVTSPCPRQQKTKTPLKNYYVLLMIGHVARRPARGTSKSNESSYSEGP
jgi:hypothetical protein